MNKCNSCIILTVLSLLLTHTNCAFAAFTGTGSLYSEVTTIKETDGRDYDLTDKRLMNCEMKFTSKPNTVALDCAGTELEVEGQNFNMSWHIFYKDDDDYEIDFEITNDIFNALAVDGANSFQIDAIVNCNLDRDAVNEEDFLPAASHTLDIAHCHISDKSLDCYTLQEINTDGKEMCPGQDLESSEVQDFDFTLSPGSSAVEIRVVPKKGRRRRILI